MSDTCRKCGYPLVAGTCDNGCEQRLLPHDIIDDLKHLRTLYTTGPCAQSSSILHQRSRTREIINDAIERIERLTAVCKCLHTAVVNPCRFANPAPCGKCEACHRIQMACEAATLVLKDGEEE